MVGGARVDARGSPGTEPALGFCVTGDSLWDSRHRGSPPKKFGGMLDRAGASRDVRVQSVSRGGHWVFRGPEKE